MNNNEKTQMRIPGIVRSLFPSMNNKALRDHNELPSGQGIYIPVRIIYIMKTRLLFVCVCVCLTVSIKEIGNRNRIHI